jgi:CrcB protein
MEPRIPIAYFYYKYYGGFLGAYTTFSTFGYEVIMLLEGGSLLTAGLYTLLSVVIGFAGVALGVGLARML